MAQHLCLSGIGLNETHCNHMVTFSEITVLIKYALIGRRPDDYGLRWLALLLKLIFLPAPEAFITAFTKARKYGKSNSSSLS